MARAFREIIPRRVFSCSLGVPIGAAMTRGWRWPTIAGFSALVLAAAGVGALVPAVRPPLASATPVPVAVRVAEAHPGSGRVQHPLWLRVQGEGGVGSPLVTSSA